MDFMFKVISGQPVMPGVLIVEAFGQAAAALTARIDPKEYENKLVFLMSVDKARFRNPVIPDCELHLDIEAVNRMEGFGNTRAQQKLMEKGRPTLNGQLQL